MDYWATIQRLAHKIGWIVFKDDSEHLYILFWPR